MKKPLVIILTVICGLLVNIIAAVPAAWSFLCENSALGVILGIAIAIGLAALLNLIGKKLEGKCGLKRHVFLLLAQMPFVVFMAALFIPNAVALHNYIPTNDMWTGLHYLGLEVGNCVYLGGLATSAAVTLGAFIVMLVEKKGLYSRKN